jgi:hypothetical protein
MFVLLSLYVSEMIASKTIEYDVFSLCNLLTYCGYIRPILLSLHSFYVPTYIPNIKQASLTSTCPDNAGSYNSQARTEANRDVTDMA